MSLNIDGSFLEKFKGILKQGKKKKADIICLQETHLRENKQFTIEMHKKPGMSFHWNSVKKNNTTKTNGLVTIFKDNIGARYTNNIHIVNNLVKELKGKNPPRGLSVKTWHNQLEDFGNRIIISEEIIGNNKKKKESYY